MPVIKRFISDLDWQHSKSVWSLEWVSKTGVKVACKVRLISNLCFDDPKDVWTGSLFPYDLSTDFITTSNWTSVLYNPTVIRGRQTFLKFSRITHHGSSPRGILKKDYHSTDWEGLRLAHDDCQTSWKNCQQALHEVSKESVGRISHKKDNLTKGGATACLKTLFALGKTEHEGFIEFKSAPLTRHWAKHHNAVARFIANNACEIGSELADLKSILDERPTIQNGFVNVVFGCTREKMDGAIDYETKGRIAGILGVQVPKAKVDNHGSASGAVRGLVPTKTISLQLMAVLLRRTHPAAPPSMVGKSVTMIRREADLKKFFQEKAPAMKKLKAESGAGRSSVFCWQPEGNGVTAMQQHLQQASTEAAAVHQNLSKDPPASGATAIPQMSVDPLGTMAVLTSTRALHLSERLGESDEVGDRVMAEFSGSWLTVVSVSKQEIHQFVNGELKIGGVEITNMKPVEKADDYLPVYYNQSTKEPGQQVPSWVLFYTGAVGGDSWSLVPVDHGGPLNKKVVTIESKDWVIRESVVRVPAANTSLQAALSSVGFHELEDGMDACLPPFTKAGSFVVMGRHELTPADQPGTDVEGILYSEDGLCVYGSPQDANPAPPNDPKGDALPKLTANGTPESK